MKTKLKKALAVMTGLLMTVPAFAGFSEGRIDTAKAAASVPAFPGAVGGGKYATGGRGGEVVHVTNLNDSGEGSFRDAVSKPNRIVVFDVSGTIELEGNILVSSNVTIAGQTAPGGSGITLKNYKLGMAGDNIICRYISSRPGPYKSTSSGNDAWGGAKGSNSIIDHCSMSWTTDEQWGLYSNNEYYTVQYSIIGPSDSWGGHSKGIHGFGMMMGNGYLTFDHNLIVHNVSRNFRGKIPGTKTADFTNNVIYNWAYETAYGTIGHLNYVGNTLKMGNGTTGGLRYVNVDSSTNPQNFSIYLTGNRMLNKDGSVYGSITYNNWAGVTYKSGLGKNEANTRSNSAFSTMINGENVSTAMTAESAEASYNNVIKYAGNGISPDLRTAVDKQVTYETMTGTGNLSGTAPYSEADSTQQATISKYKIQCGTVYKYPGSVLSKTIKDTDNDGMPDEWELARGLDPADPGDTNGDYCGQGYTNIEYYINDLTIDSFPSGVVKLSPEMSEPLPSKSAFELIEAEDFDDQYGIKAEDCSEGGQNIGYIENGDYLVYRNVDFGDGAQSFTARLAGDTAGIELYLDSLSNSPVASLKFNGTSGWQDWQDITFGIKKISKKHTLYIKFTGGEGYLLNVNNFVFGPDAIPVNGRLIKNLLIKDAANETAWYISDNTKTGSQIFGDRDYTYIDFPEQITGAEAVVTACGSKNYTGDMAEFTAGTDITVYTALDSRVSPPPSWLDSWEKTSMICHSSNDVTFELYSKNFSSGETVTLGTNFQGAACVNYGVFITENKSAADTSGDVNSDGSVTASDIMALKKSLLGTQTLTEEQRKNADIDSNGKINILDLIFLIEKLL